LKPSDDSFSRDEIAIMVAKLTLNTVIYLEVRVPWKDEPTRIGLTQ